MPQNQAAWLKTKYAPLEVGEAAYVEPGPGEILVRNRAVAINPVDWAIQYLGSLLFRWVTYPCVLGYDLSGDVVAVGSDVTDVKVGDRVVAAATGVNLGRVVAAEGAFQSYTITHPRLTAIIPDHVSYAEACVIPLGAMTAACGLFQKDLLALDLPAASPTPKDKWVIIWGGATSVGSNAIQLAACAGYKVLTTASAKNFDYVTSLGASLAFDYKSKTVIQDIIAALQGKEIVGALAIGAGSALDCLDILPHCRGRQFIANCSAGFSFDALKGRKITFPTLLKLIPLMVSTALKQRRKSRQAGIKPKFFDASSVTANEVGPAIFRDFLGPALADHRFRPAPAPQVVGTGLGAIQTAFGIQRQGVSASKIVVTLD